MGVPRLSPNEIEAREERARAYTKQYYSKPEVKLRQKEYYKKYNQVPSNKEDHRRTQARYINTVKGMRTKRKNENKPRQNKDDNNNYPGISVQS